MKLSFSMLPFVFSGLLSIGYAVDSNQSSGQDKGLATNPNLWIVTTSSDTINGQDLSLRDAIIAANADPQTHDLIRIQVSEVSLESTLPAINGDVTIIGDGSVASSFKGLSSGSVIDGDESFGLLSIENGYVRLENLLLKDGYAQGGTGAVGSGGAPGGSGAGLGGGLFLLDGDVFLYNVIFDNCIAEGGDEVVVTLDGSIPSDFQIGGGGGGTLGSGQDDGTGGDGGRGPGSGMGIAPSCFLDSSPLEAGGSGGIGSCELISGRNGRDGNFGGGGGGGAGVEGNGGDGGFGAGGGAAVTATGGINGAGGELGGNARTEGLDAISGAGAGLGGAIFALGGTLELDLVAFTNNQALGGQNPDSLEVAAAGKGGAIFIGESATVSANPETVIFSNNQKRDIPVFTPAGLDFLPGQFIDTPDIYGVMNEFRAPYRVTENTDSLGISDGEKGIFSGPMNLRQAIFNAEATPGPDIIEIDESVSEIVLTQTMQTITDGLEIRVLPLGQPAEFARKVTIRGDNTFPLMAVGPKQTFSEGEKGLIEDRFEVLIQDLILTDGRANGGDGGNGSYVQGDGADQREIIAGFPGGGGAGMGGALLIDANALVNLVRVDITRNSAIGGNGGQFIKFVGIPENSMSPAGAGGGGLGGNGGRATFNTGGPVEFDEAFGGISPRLNQFVNWDPVCNPFLITPDGVGGFGRVNFCNQNPVEDVLQGSNGGFGGGGGGGTISKVNVINEISFGGDGGFGGGGGGGSKTINRASGIGGRFAGNGFFELLEESVTFVGGGGGGAGLGGGIFLRTGTLRIADSQISLNSASRGVGFNPADVDVRSDGFAKGGGIFAMNAPGDGVTGAGRVFLANVNFTGNTARDRSTPIPTVIFNQENDSTEFYGVPEEDPGSPKANFELLPNGLFFIPPFVAKDEAFVEVTFGRENGSPVEIVSANVDVTDFRLIFDAREKGLNQTLPFIESIVETEPQVWLLKINAGSFVDSANTGKLTKLRVAMDPDHNLWSTDNLAPVLDDSPPSAVIHFDTAPPTLSVSEPFPQGCTTRTTIEYVLTYSEPVGFIDPSNFVAQFTPTDGSPIDVSGTISFSNNSDEFTNGDFYATEIKISYPLLPTDTGLLVINYNEDAVDQAGNESTALPRDFVIQKTSSVVQVGSYFVDLTQGNIQNVGGSGCENTRVPFNLSGGSILLDNRDDFSESVFKLRAKESDDNSGDASRVEFTENLISGFDAQIIADTASGIVLYEGNFTINTTSNAITLANPLTNYSLGRLPFEVCRIAYNPTDRRLIFAGAPKSTNFSGMTFRDMFFTRSGRLDTASMVMELVDQQPCNSSSDAIQFNVTNFTIIDDDTDNRIVVNSTVNETAHPELADVDLSLDFIIDRVSSEPEFIQQQGFYKINLKTQSIKSFDLSENEIILRSEFETADANIFLTHRLLPPTVENNEAVFEEPSATFDIGGRTIETADDGDDSVVTFIDSTTLFLGTVILPVTDLFSSAEISEVSAVLNGQITSGGGPFSRIDLDGIPFAAGSGNFTSTQFDMEDGLSFPPNSPLLGALGTLGNIAAIVPSMNFETENQSDLNINTTETPDLKLSEATFGLLGLGVGFNEFNISGTGNAPVIDFDGGIELPDNIGGAKLRIAGSLEKEEDGAFEFNLSQFEFQSPSTPPGVNPEFKIKKAAFGLPTFGMLLDVDNSLWEGNAALDVVGVFAIDIKKLGFRVLTDGITQVLLDSLIVELELPKAIPIGSTGLGLKKIRGGFENLVRTPRQYEIKYIDFSTTPPNRNAMETLFGIAPTRVVAGLTAIGGPEIPLLGALLAIDVDGSVDETQIAVTGSATMLGLIKTASGYARLAWSGPRPGTGFGGYFTHIVIRATIDAFLGFVPSSFNVCADLSLQIPDSVPIVGGMKLGSISGCFGAKPFRITGCIDLFFFDACFTIKAGNIKAKKAEGEEWRRSLHEPVPLYTFTDLKSGQPAQIEFIGFTNFTEQASVQKSASVLKGNSSVVNIVSATTGSGIIRLNHELTTNQGADPRFVVTSPSGKMLTPDVDILDPDFDPSLVDFAFLSNPGSFDSSYIIDNLELGTYVVTILEPNTLGNFEVSLAAETPAPRFEFTGVTVVNNELIIEWDDDNLSNTEYQFFLGTDGQTGSGQEITDPENPIPADENNNILVVDLNSLVHKADSTDSGLALTPEQLQAIAETGVTLEQQIITLGEGEYYPFVVMTQKPVAPVDPDDVIRRDTITADLPINIPGPDITINIENFDAFSTGNGFLATWELPEGEVPNSSLKLIWTDRPSLNVYEKGQAVPAGETFAIVQTRTEIKDDAFADGPAIFERTFKPGAQYKVALSAMMPVEFNKSKRTDNYRLISETARKVMTFKSSSHSDRVAFAREILEQDAASKNASLSEPELLSFSNQSARLARSIEANEARYGFSDSKLVAKAAKVTGGNKISAKGTLSGLLYAETIIAGPDVITLDYPEGQNTPPRFVTEPLLYVQAGDLYQSIVQAVDTNSDPINYSIELGPESMSINSDGLIQWQTSNSDILSADDFANNAEANLIRVRATDSNGGFSEKEFHLEVGQLPARRSLQIITAAPSDVQRGDTYEYQVGAISSARTPVLWELIEAPSGMLIEQPALEIEYDGDGSDSAYQTVATWTQNDTGFGDFGMRELRVARDDTKLSFAVIGDSEENFNEFIIMLGHDDASGVPSGVALPSGNDGLSPFFTFNPTLDFEADFGIRATFGIENSDPPTAFVSIIDYRVGNTDSFLGSAILGAGPITSTSPAFPSARFAAQNPTTSGLSNTINEGFEFSIDLADLGADASSNFQILAIYGNDSFVSANTLPEVPGQSPTFLGDDPDFTLINGSQFVEIPAGVTTPPNQFNTSFANIVWPISAQQDLGSYRVIVRGKTVIGGKEVSDSQEFFVNVELNSDFLIEFKDLQSLISLWLIN